MKSINFELPEQQFIEINGDKFPVMHTDIDVLEHAIKIKEAAENLDKNDAKAIVETIRSAINYIDDILGDGAMKKISKGRPVGLMQSIELMTEINMAIMENYSDTVKNKYNIGPKPQDNE